VKLALDTNVLAYAEGVNGAERKAMAMALISRIPQDGGVVPAQVLGELFNVLVRKAGRSCASARDSLLSWRDTFAIASTEPATMVLAADLAVHHQLAIWHLVIMATASQVGCRLLLSEDMQDGFTWNGVSVVNPFSATASPMLESLLDN
jgi:predicted nucleic acid-binding protein